MKKIEGYEPYYVPDQSIWPLMGSIGLGTFVSGLVGLFNQTSYGPVFFYYRCNYSYIYVVWMVWKCYS